MVCKKLDYVPDWLKAFIYIFKPTGIIFNKSVSVKIKKLLLEDHSSENIFEKSEITSNMWFEKSCKISLFTVALVLRWPLYRRGSLTYFCFTKICYTPIPVQELSRIQAAVTKNISHLFSHHTLLYISLHEFTKIFYEAWARRYKARKLLQ